MARQKSGHGNVFFRKFYGSRGVLCVLRGKWLKSPANAPRIKAGISAERRMCVLKIFDYLSYVLLVKDAFRNLAMDAHDVLFGLKRPELRIEAQMDMTIHIALDDRNTLGNQV
jgi:hypothetical protein